MFGRRRKLPGGLRPNLARDERVIAWAFTGGRASGGGASAGAGDLGSAGGGGAGDLGSAGGALGGAGDRAAVVVTTLGTWLPGRGERLGWHQIHKATWSGTRLTIVPAVEVSGGEGYAVMADEPPVVLALPDPDDVPPEIRKRVTRSVAHTSHHPVPGGGVLVVARRVPGIDGVTWHVRYDEGTDATDPDVVSATAEHVSAATTPTNSD